MKEATSSVSVTNELHTEVVIPTRMCEQRFEVGLTIIRHESAVSSSQDSRVDKVGDVTNRRVISCCSRRKLGSLAIIVMNWRDKVSRQSTLLIRALTFMNEGLLAWNAPGCAHNLVLSQTNPYSRRSNDVHAEDGQVTVPTRIDFHRQPYSCRVAW